MDLRKEFAKALEKAEPLLMKWKPFRIGMEIAEKTFDDSPVEKSWVQNIIDEVEANPLIYKFTGQTNSIMGSMLWRASCNGFDDIIEHISSNYTEQVAEISGHSFWCAAIDGNLNGMKILMNYFEEHIQPNDIGEALGRASYSSKMDIIDYLLQDHGDKLEARHINSAIQNAAAFAQTQTIIKLCSERKMDITCDGIELAITQAQNQKKFLGDKYGFDTAISVLETHKLQLNTTGPRFSQTKNNSNRP